METASTIRKHTFLRRTRCYLLLNNNSQQSIQINKNMKVSRSAAFFTKNVLLALISYRGRPKISFQEKTLKWRQ